MKCQFYTSEKRKTSKLGEDFIWTRKSMIQRKCANDVFSLLLAESIVNILSNNTSTKAISNQGNSAIIKNNGTFLKSS